MSRSSLNAGTMTEIRTVELWLNAATFQLSKACLVALQAFDISAGNGYSKAQLLQGKEPMNKQSSSLAAGAVSAGVMSLALVTAHAQMDRFYVRGDLGGTWMPDTELKEFFGPVAHGSKVKFDPGGRFGVAAGYNVTDWFAAEAETGVMANNIDSITDADRVDASFANVPFLVNVRLQLPNTRHIKPFIGGGLGGSAAVIDANHIDLNGVRVHGNQSDAVFAYQAFGGIRYQLNEHMGLSLEYHYFATTSPEWKADFTAGAESNRLKFGGMQTHAVSVAFDYKF